MLDSIIEEANKSVTKIDTKKKKARPKKKITVKPKAVKKTVTEQKQQHVSNVSALQPSIEEPISLVDIGKQDMFNLFMKNVDTKQMDLTKKNIEELKSGISNISETSSFIVRLCNSIDCKQIQICPFNKIGKYPSGYKCPVESAIADFMSKEYFAMLTQELGHNNFNIVEINTVNSLIEVELEEFRARIYSNIQGQIVRNAVFVVKDTGEVIYNDIENPIYNLRERLDRRKSKLLQRILITPEAKARFKVEDKGRGGKKTEDLIHSAEEKIQQLKMDNLDATKGSESSTK